MNNVRAVPKNVCGKQNVTPKSGKALSYRILASIIINDVDDELILNSFPYVLRRALGRRNHCCVAALRDCYSSDERYSKHVQKTFESHNYNG